MKHRMPFQSVFYLAVDGEAQLHSIQISGGSPTMSMPGNPSGYLPVPGQMPMPGQVPMPGQMNIPGNQPGYMPAGQMPMPGVHGTVGAPYSTGYGAYPGQSHNSPYLQVTI